MAMQDHPLMYADQAVNITTQRDLDSSYSAGQSVEPTHRRWARITNMNWQGITNWSVNPMAGSWSKLRTRDGWRQIFDADDGATVYRVVKITEEDTRFGFSESQVGDFYIVRGWVETVPKAFYTQECKYLMRPKGAWLNARPSITMFRPDCYIGPYLHDWEAEDDARNWAIEDQTDADTYELATDPVQLAFHIDRAVGAVM